MNTKPKTQRDFDSEESKLEAMFWRRWLLLASMPVVTTVVLAAVLPLVRRLVPDVWPWSGTDLLLITGLYVMIVIFAWYLTMQQRQILRLRDRLLAERYRAKEASQRHRQRLMALYALSQAIGDENDPRRVFDKLTRICKDIFHSDRASLMLLDHADDTLVVRSAIGHADLEKVIGARRKMGEGIAGWVAQNRQPLLLGHDDPRSRFDGSFTDDSELRSAMVVPLIVRGRVVGVLNVANDKSDIPYDDDDLTTLQVFAETAEYCLRHAENADWMRGLIRKLQDIGDGRGRPPAPEVADAATAEKARVEASRIRETEVLVP